MNFIQKFFQKRAAQKAEQKADRLNRELMNATYGNNSKRVRDALAKGAKVCLTHGKNYRGETLGGALHEAASNESEEIVDLLLESGVSAQIAEDALLHTPFKAVSIIKKLLKFEISKEAKDKLYIAAAKNNAIDAMALLPETDEVTRDLALQGAAYFHANEAVAYLIDKGTTVAGRDAALHKILGRHYKYESDMYENLPKYEPIFRALLKAGLSQDVQSQALPSALKFWRTDTVAALLEAGVNEYTKSESLPAAIADNSLRRIRLVVESGVDKEALKSALKPAVVNGDGEKLSYLYNKLEERLSNAEEAARKSELAGAFMRSTKGLKEDELALPIVAFYEEKGFLPTQSRVAILTNAATPA